MLCDTAGFDACGHMSEETKNADVSAPWGIIVALATSAVVGWGYIMALLFSIQVRQKRPDALSMATMQGRSLRIYACSAEYELVQLPCPITNGSRGPDLWHAHCQHGPLLWVTQCTCCPGSHRLGNRKCEWVHDRPDLLRCLQCAQTPLFCHDMIILDVLPFD